MNIDLSGFDGVLDAVYRYEVYRQMIKKLTDELSCHKLSCEISPQSLCIETYWGYNIYLKGLEYSDDITEPTHMSYESMCGCCKRKQDIINERKRCKRLFGVAKTAISREGKTMIKDFTNPDTSFDQPYNPFEDPDINPLGVGREGSRSTPDLDMMADVSLRGLEGIAKGEKGIQWEGPL